MNHIVPGTQPQPNPSRAGQGRQDCATVQYSISLPHSVLVEFIDVSSMVQQEELTLIRWEHLNKMAYCLIREW